MKQGEVSLAFPCGRDFASMSPAVGGRLCAECKTVVHNLSSMSEGGARQLLESSASRLCVRYLYDDTGRVRFADDPDVSQARIIPAFRLSPRRRAQAAKLALLAAPLVLFEACGGGPGVVATEQNWEPTGTTADDGGLDESATEAGAIPTEDASDGGTGEQESGPAHQ